MASLNGFYQPRNVRRVVDAFLEQIIAPAELSKGSRRSADSLLLHICTADSTLRCHRHRKGQPGASSIDTCTSLISKRTQMAAVFGCSR